MNTRAVSHLNIEYRWLFGQMQPSHKPCVILQECRILRYFWTTKVALDAYVSLQPSFSLISLQLQFLHAHARKYIFREIFKCCLRCINLFSFPNCYCTFTSSSLKEKCSFFYYNYMLSFLLIAIICFIIYCCCIVDTQDMTKAKFVWISVVLD